MSERVHTPTDPTDESSGAARSEPPAAARPVFRFSADEVADASRLAERMGTTVRFGTAPASDESSSSAIAQDCAICEATIVGEPAGRGLLLWTRGEEARWEEPALCPKCGVAIAIRALAEWRREEEEG